MIFGRHFDTLLATEYSTVYDSNDTLPRGSALASYSGRILLQNQKWDLLLGVDVLYSITGNAQLG